RQFSFSRLRAVTVSGSVGLLGGLVGQGGSFILIPLMTSYMQVPTRIAIGSNLAIVFLSSLAAFMGKAVTGQIDWLLAVPIVLTVVPAAHFGGRVSRRVSVATLRRILAVFIALASVRIGFTALGF
ncbi:MAG: sulfite exporter TauE/SafE family protein, partial [Desulfobulbaceae bacterium]|nr:sulfite exporter TauE/SafE family protein [Desulfobulbaceae bacterium]